MMFPNSGQSFLDELAKLNVKFSLDRQNKVHLVRKLPPEVADMLPKELIPNSVLHLLKQFKEGSLKKSIIGAPKYHDRIKILRRYHLISPVQRRTPSEKRIRNRDYLRNWRRMHAAATTV